VLNILQIISYNRKGGAEAFIENLVNEMVKSDKVKYVHILTFSNELPEVKLDLITSKKLVHYHYYNSSKNFFLSFIPIFKYILKLIRINKYNVIHSHLLTPLYIWPLPILFRNLFFAHTIHSQAEKELGAKKLSIHFLIRKLYYKLSNIICISESVHLSVQKLYNLDAKIIYNGTLFKRSSSVKVDKIICSGMKKFLAVGHTRKVKNFKLLIDAFHKYSDEAMLIILGKLIDDFKGINLKEYQNKNIFFLGEVTNVQDYMKKADFLCMTSHYEGMPITILEAKANRLLPIVTPAPGITDLIKHGLNGIVSDDFRVESYERVLGEALEISKQEKNRMINEGYNEFVNNYTIAVCANNHIDSYNAN